MQNGSDYTVHFGLLQEPRLTPTSFIVLGLIELSGEATPYELKSAVSVSLGNFWSLQHAQLYSEPERLAKAGYLKERREEGGRRRRHYSLTKKGAEALAEWRETPAERLSSCATSGCSRSSSAPIPAQVAEAQIEMYRRKLAEYEGLMSLDVGERAARPVAHPRGGDSPHQAVDRVLGGAAREAPPPRLGSAAMATAAEPLRAVLPLPGGRKGATVTLRPLLVATMTGPAGFFHREDGRGGRLGTLLDIVSPRARAEVPVVAYLVEHPGAGLFLIDTGFHAVGGSAAARSHRPRRRAAVQGRAHGGRATPCPASCAGAGHRPAARSERS